MALERTTRKAKSDVVQAEASLKAKEAEFNRQKDRLEKIKLQIENTKIYAPADGLVLYATSSERGPMRGMSEPLDEGSSVRERQELIHLPTTSGFNAEIGIYEASLDKIRLGLPVVLTIDALPGERFIGTVSNIAPVPDAMSSFMNPDLSIYDTVIEINNSENVKDLKSGMSCKAEVIIEQHEDAVYVPVQAVIRVDNKPTVFLAKGNKLRPRPVKIGLDNGRMIHILEGLEEGEEVTLTPPLIQASISENVEEIIDDITIPSSEASPNQSLPGERSSRQGNGMNNMQMPGSKDDMIKMMDKDGDGKISKDETPFPEEAFSQMDVNGDGFIDKSEIPDFPAGGMNQGPPSKDNMIKMMDKDGDGKISEDEAPFPGDAFSQMDANGDGFIDKSEIPDFSQMRGGQGGFGGGQGGFGGGQGGGMPGGGFGFPGGGGR